MWTKYVKKWEKIYCAIIHQCFGETDQTTADFQLYLEAVSPSSCVQEPKVIIYDSNLGMLRRGSSLGAAFYKQT